MNEDQELEEYEQWLNDLRSMEDQVDIRSKGRPFFDNTAEMNIFIENYKGKHER